MWSNYDRCYYRCRTIVYCCERWDVSIANGCQSYGRLIVGPCIGRDTSSIDRCKSDYRGVVSVAYNLACRLVNLACRIDCDCYIKDGACTTIDTRRNKIMYYYRFCCGIDECLRDSCTAA